MRFFIGVSFIFFAVSSANAQSPKVPKELLPLTVANSIKCEIGEAAVAFRRYHLSATLSRVKVTVTNSGAYSGSLGLAISSIVANLFKFGGSVSRTTTDGNVTAITYNFSSKQLPNCSKRNRVPTPPGIGIGDCLAKIEPAIALQARGNDGTVQSQTCTGQIDVKEDVQGSGGIPTSVFSVGPTGEFFHTGSLKLEVLLPAGP